MRKRMIMGMLAGAMLSLCACGQSSPATDQEVSLLEAEESVVENVVQHEEDFEEASEDEFEEDFPKETRIEYDVETPFEENEYISLFLREYWEVDGGATLKVDMVNNGPQTVYMTSEVWKINGVDCREYPGFNITKGYGDLAPGETVTMEYRWASVNELGIEDQIEDIVVTCVLWESNGMKLHDYFWKEAFKITPEAQEPVEPYDREVAENEKVLWDDEYGRVIYTGKQKEGNDIYIMFYVENRKDEYIEFKITDVVMDGKETDFKWSFVELGNSFYEDESLPLFGNLLEKQGLSEPERLEFTLRINSWMNKEEYASEKISLDL